jgi:symplekin
MQVGFTTLRGLVIQRPSMRADALNVLLELTTHPGLQFPTYVYRKVSDDHVSEKKTRGAAINTVKLWVPNTQPMDAMIRHFALQMLRKLQLQPPSTSSKSGDDVTMNGGEDGEPTDVMLDGAEEEIKPTILPAEELEEGEDENMEDGQLPPEELVQTPYLPERIELPAQKSHVLQHVELLFALSVKVPEFLDESVPMSFHL